MPLSTNTSVKLDAHKPKKDAEFYTDGGHAPTGATEITCWAAAGVEVGNRTEVVATFEKLLTYALSNLNTMQPSAGPTIVHAVLSPSDPQIAIDGTPESTECRIEIGADLVDKEQSHFIKRTVDRILERMLEVSK
jgi:hypothetical protein